MNKSPEGQRAFREKSAYDCNQSKTCQACGISKPATTEFFHRHRGDFHPNCKECRNKKKRQGRDYLLPHRPTHPKSPARESGYTDINKSRRVHPCPQCGGSTYNLICSACFVTAEAERKFIEFGGDFIRCYGGV